MNLRPEFRAFGWTGTLATLGSLFALLTSRWLGPEERGSVVIFLTTASLLMLVGSGGVATSMRVLFHSEPHLSLHTYRARTRLLVVVHISTSAALGSWVLRETHSGPSLAVYAYFPLYACLLLYSYFQREALYALGKIDQAMLSDIVPILVQLVGLLALHSAGHVNLRAVLTIIAMGGFTQSLFLYLVVRQYETPTAQSDWTLLMLLRHGLPAIAITLGQALTLRGDRLILGLWAGPATVGIYGAAATFTELLSLLPTAVGQVIVHRVSLDRTIHSQTHRGARTMLVTGVGAIVLIANAHWLIPALLGTAFRGAVQLTYVLAIAAIPLSWYYVNVSTLIGLGRLRSAGAVTAVGALVLFMGCALLVPPLQGMGAAWASLASYSTLGLASWAGLRSFTPKPRA